MTNGRIFSRTSQAISEIQARVFWGINDARNAKCSRTPRVPSKASCEHHVKYTSHRSLTHRATTLRQNVSSINDPIVSFARRNLFIFYWFVEANAKCAWTRLIRLCRECARAFAWKHKRAYWVCTRHTHWFVHSSIGSPPVAVLDPNKIIKYHHRPSAYVSAPAIYVRDYAGGAAQVQWTRNVIVVFDRLMSHIRNILNSIGKWFRVSV